MKKISAIFVAVLALALVGCSAGETSQSDIEKDAEQITLDKNATPNTSVSEGAVTMPGGAKKNTGK